MYPSAPAIAQPVTDSLPTFYAEEPAIHRQPFGGWLVKQVTHRSEWIANLAKAAKADPGFPKAGDPEEVRKYLSGRGADGDVFEAIDDAEREWERL
ncbi:YozE family protein [Sphingomonas naphthae]|uniref:YozE family protein n=1 Tax=Sphingomonas naphthae TaxID=1813468 RepID=A0ABY7TP92_9SPHN|nr:YozE family protein [Sphingomonas naphthae]WCT75063.1 YozE family protein [Sphingomonas naphthae]